MALYASGNNNYDTAAVFLVGPNSGVLASDLEIVQRWRLPGALGGITVFARFPEQPLPVLPTPSLAAPPPRASTLHRLAR